MSRLKRTVRKYGFLLGSGALLMQAPGCTETAAIVTSVATSLTAGGVLFIVSRLLED